MPQPKFPLEGSCRCNAVRFRVTEPPLITAACHCRGCQRMSASAFSLTAICLAQSFEITQGATVLGGNRSPELQHYFCGHCMTWMYGKPVELPHVVNVRPTLLDDHAWFAPFIETYTRTRLPWAKTGAVHSFDEFPPPESFGDLLSEYQAWRDAQK